jgi:hypothetical protein
MKRLIGLLTVLACASSPAIAQGARGATARGGASHPAPRPEVGGGHIPARGPTRTPAPKAPAPKRTAPVNYAHATGHPNAPHVDVKTNVWVGHDTRRDEPGLRIAHPWAHGHFGGEIGANHVYRLGGGDFHRFGFGGFFFGVAAADWAYCNDWLWDNDDITLYDDPDHPGYYIAYNVRLGTYVHVEYLGE